MKYRELTINQKINIKSWIAFATFAFSKYADQSQRKTLYNYAVGNYSGFKVSFPMGSIIPKN